MIKDPQVKLNEISQQLLSITEEILNLGPDEDTFENDLEKLQLQQQAIRNEATEITMEYNLVIDVSIVEQCIRMEQMIQINLHRFKTEAKAQFDNIQNGSKAKNAYQRIYQIEGVFIDRQN